MVVLVALPFGVDHLGTITSILQMLVVS